MSGGVKCECVDESFSKYDVNDHERRSGGHQESTDLSWLQVQFIWVLSHIAVRHFGTTSLLGLCRPGNHTQQ